MKGKIVSLSLQRQKKKPRSPEEAAEAAARLILDRFPKDLQEPPALASGGDMSKILEELKAYLEEAFGVAPVKVVADFGHAFLGKRGIVAFDISGWRSASGHLATPTNEGTTTGMTLWHF